MLTRLLTRLARQVPVFVTVEALGRSRRWSVESVKSSSADHLNKEGLYAWYADAHGQDVLREAGLYVRHDGLAYVGMTGKFARRLEEHIDCNRARKLKDLCGVLTCVLGGHSSSDGVEQLLRHFTVAMTPVRFARKRKEHVLRAERRIIEEAEPCLNLQWVSKASPNFKRLTELKERAKTTFDDGDPAVDEEPPSSLPRLLDRAFRGLEQVLAIMRPGPRRSTSANADSAAPPEDDGNQVHDAEPSRKLTEMGRFRQDFWTRVSKRHPGEAPPGWASSNVRRQVQTTGRCFSLYVARDGVGVFFPRNRDESSRKRAAAVRATVKWLRKKTGNAEMPDNGWSFLKLDPRAKRNENRMADWLHVHRLLYEYALHETADSGSSKHR